MKSLKKIRTQKDLTKIEIAFNLPEKSYIWTCAAQTGPAALNRFLNTFELIIFISWKNQANFQKRGRAGLERVNRFVPRFLKGRN